MSASPGTSPVTRVRPATESDVDRIHRLVVELAEYEREPDAVQASVADFRSALFGADPKVHAHVAEVDGDVVGFALWFVNFSTWRGRHGIWLEDLFVRPQHRGLGLGKALLATLADECVQRGYPRLEWYVLDWNTPSIEFYRSLGAVPLDEWTVHRLTDEALTSVAASAPGRATPARPTSADRSTTAGRS